MSPLVFDPDTDTLRAPRFVTPDRLTRTILELMGSADAYEAASRSALRFVQESFLPEQALDLAYTHLDRLAEAHRGS
jgi:hypothetical protein